MSINIRTLIYTSILFLFASYSIASPTHDNSLKHSRLDKKISIEEIWDDYKANIPEAVSKWTQMKVTLTGTIDNIKTRAFKTDKKGTTQDFYLVTIKDQANSTCMGTIKMDNTQANIEQIKTLKQGDTVSIHTQLYQPSRYITGDIPPCSFLFDNGYFN